MNLASHDLVYYYWDSDNKKQGGFKINAMKVWEQHGYFTDDIKLHIVDNNGKPGSAGNFKTTMGRLRNVFGRNNPFPQRKEECTPHLKYLTAGSPAKNEKKQTQPLKKLNTTKKSIKCYVPFFSGFVPELAEKNNLTVPPASLMVELASELSNQIMSMGYEKRHELIEEFSKIKREEKCELCDSDIKQPLNFLSHILSEKHIMKHAKYDIVFTYERDYLAMDKFIKNAKNEVPLCETLQRMKIV